MPPVVSMSEFVALDSIEFDACIDLYCAAPEDVKRVHAIDVREVTGVACMTSRGIEPAVMFRRATGLGVASAAREAQVEEVLAYMAGVGLRYAVPVAPQSRPPGLGSWLERRGFERGYAWMKFSRPCSDAPLPASDLETRVIGRELAAEFARIVVAGFGLPTSVVPWIAALVGRPMWTCMLAFASGTPVAAGALFVKGSHAWLGLGATLAEHRRLGAQGALLASRIGAAAEQGARVAVTETGERLADKPSISYRNILRAGFEERYVRQNYLSPAA